MAEAFAVVGLVAAILQFSQLCSKIVGRINDFSSAIEQNSKGFQVRHISYCFILYTAPSVSDPSARVVLNKIAIVSVTTRMHLPAVSACFLSAS